MGGQHIAKGCFHRGPPKLTQTVDHGYRYSSPALAGSGSMEFIFFNFTVKSAPFVRMRYYCKIHYSTMLLLTRHAYEFTIRGGGLDQTWDLLLIERFYLF